MTTYGFCITSLPSGNFSLRENDSPRVDIFDDWRDARQAVEELVGHVLDWNFEYAEDPEGTQPAECWYAEFTTPE